MKDTTRRFLILAAMMMALGVMIGAFGAHALKESLDDYSRGIFATGVEYQFYHALGLFVVAFALHVKENTKIRVAGYIMLGSIFVFSGSLYILALTGLTWLGAITPIGGLGFIVAWILLAIGINNKERKNK